MNDKGIKITQPNSEDQPQEGAFNARLHQLEFSSDWYKEIEYGRGGMSWKQSKWGQLQIKRSRGQIRGGGKEGESDRTDSKEFVQTSFFGEGE